MKIWKSLKILTNLATTLSILKLFTPRDTRKSLNDTSMFDELKMTFYNLVLQSKDKRILSKKFKRKVSRVERKKVYHFFRQCKTIPKKIPSQSQWNNSNSSCSFFFKHTQATRHKTQKTEELRALNGSKEDKCET